LLTDLINLKTKTKTYLPTAIEMEIYPHLESNILTKVKEKID